MRKGMSRRFGTVLASACGAIALAVSGAGGTSVTSAAAKTDASAVVCEPGASDAAAEARVRPGYQGPLPGALTPAQSAAYEADLQARIGQRNLAGRAAAERFTTIEIDVHIHVIARDDGTGGVTRQMVRDQIRVLNDAFAGRTAGQSEWSPFRFRIATYDVTRNSDWYDWNEDDERPAKRALHRGGMDDLNIYIAALGGGLLGYAFYPQDQVGFQDGVVLLGESLPGGSAAPYNLGDTATHEVGHWLGLAHTFDNGCEAPGDRVDDTPYQDDGPNIFECVESLNTCPQRGRDPVHNFMSYGDDECLDRFTEGQGLRMVLSWLAYRDPDA
jgi:hypothetical protein